MFHLGVCIEHFLCARLSDRCSEYEGEYYFCNSEKGIDSLGQEFIEMRAIESDASGDPITFINGTFQFPYKAYTNEYSNIQITFTLTFQAIQAKIQDKVNSIANVKSVLDEIDWEKQNNTVKIQTINF